MDYCLLHQMNTFGPIFFDFHARVKKCHFGNFSEWAGIIFVLDADEYLERLEGEIRKCLFF